MKWLKKDLIWNGSLKQDFIISQKTLWIIKHRFIVKIPEALEKHWELTGSAWKGCVQTMGERFFFNGCCLKKPKTSWSVTMWFHGCAWKNLNQRILCSLWIVWLLYRLKIIWKSRQQKAGNPWKTWSKHGRIILIWQFGSEWMCRILLSTVHESSCRDIMKW